MCCVVACSDGSVDTQYVADLSAGSTLNSDQQELLKRNIIDALNQSGILLDEDSLNFTRAFTDRLSIISPLVALLL